MTNITLTAETKQEVILVEDTWIKNESFFDILWSNDGLVTPFEDMQTWEMRSSKKFPSGTYQFYSSYPVVLSKIVV